MKIRFVHFEIAKYGGIVEEVENRLQSFKDLGHDVDIIRLTYNKDENQSRFDKQIKSLDNGSYFKDLKSDSQRGGMEKAKSSGYWKNSYYGWILPPFTNRIPVFHKDGLKMWHKAMKDVDLVFWSFMPTKTGESEGFSTWWKYFDLPESTNQVFIVHDGYFDKRSAWVTALKDKITFLECVHLAAYHSCDNIGIPRRLGMSPRMFPEKKLGIDNINDRDIDFFSAHIFKSMKKMDELVRAIRYFTYHMVAHRTIVGGADIEYNYMTSVDKVKPCYIANQKADPDLPNGLIGKRIWDLAVKAGMDYQGMLPKSKMDNYYARSKFFIDPSWSTHYAQYNRTNINSSLIEAVINGCYPVVRDYKGLEKKKLYEEDEIFNQMKAIVIPWDATPKQFAKYLTDAAKDIDKRTYKEHTDFNFQLFKKLSGAPENAKTTLSILDGNLEDLVIGEDSEAVLLQTFDVMENFFGIELPINWER